MMVRKTARKRFVAWTVLGLVCAAMIIFTIRYLNDAYRDRQAQLALDQRTEKILGHADLDSIPDFHAKMDALLDFMHANSQHKMDAEFYALWPDRLKLADTFLAGLEGRRKDLPHMECSTRSNIMAEMLEYMGYDTRNIVLYSPELNLANHRLIEVRNPDTKNWEAYDVTYHIHWRNKASGERASVAQVGADPAAHEPCNRENCGWSLRERDGNEVSRLRDYLKIAVVNDDDTDLRVALRQPDIDPNRLYVMDGRQDEFCGFFAKNCQQGYIEMNEFVAAD